MCTTAPRPASLFIFTAFLTASLSGCNATGPQPVTSSSSKNTPLITWPQPASITYPAPLTSTQLDATANVPGAFIYSPAAGTVLSAGAQTLSAVFTPADTAHYNSASASVPLVVNPAAGNPTIGNSNCSSGRSTGADTFVYVSSGVKQSSNYQIYGFVVAEDGSLEQVPGSPFVTPGVQPLGAAGTGSNLFGADSYKIYSFAIHSDGCIDQESSLVVGQPAGIGTAGQQIYDGPTSLFFDPKFQDLYSDVFVPPEEGYYAAFSFNSDTGQVTPINATPTNSVNEYPLTIASDDQYAVSTTCYFRTGPTIAEFQRGSNGALVSFGNGPLPTAAPGDFYCPLGAAADQSDHFVIAVQPYIACGGPLCNPTGDPWQFAVYTVDTAGQLSTSSTWQNMTEDSGASASFNFSPDDKYLAANDGSDVQVFTWDDQNGILSPFAKISGGGTCAGSSCSGPLFAGFKWDRNDRIYAILGQQLVVYTISSSGISPAPGSPYSVPNAASVTVVLPTAD